MRLNAVRFLYCSAILLSLGCTKAVPGFETLDSNNLPQPLFDSGSTTKTAEVRTGADTIAISGTCDFKINSIVAQVTNVDSAPGTMDHISSGTPNVTCQSDGKFSFTLKGLTSLGFTTLSDGQVYEVQLRGVTTAGISKASALRVRYCLACGNGPKRTVITLGSTQSSASERIAASDGAGSFKAVISVSNKITDPTAANAGQNTMHVQVSSGGSFKAKIGAATSSN